MSLREEIESRIRFFNHTDRQNKYTSCTDEILKLIEKRIDAKIDRVNQEFKNEGYEGIEDIWMNLDVDDIVEYKQLEREKRTLEQVKEMLK